MKKVASIVAIALFAVGMLATQAEDVLDFDFDITTMLACDDCTGGDNTGRGGTGNNGIA